jgi:thioredoxin reductase
MVVRPKDPRRVNRVDVIIVGGGPAGLSAALVLGRCRRSVLVIDAGNPPPPDAITHGFFTRDGARKCDLIDTGRKQALAVGALRINGTVKTARAVPDGFEVAIVDGTTYTSRAIILATGVRYTWPAFPGVAELLGRGVYVCGICDAMEHSGQHLAVFGNDPHAAGAACQLKQWSPGATLFTGGGHLSADDQARLKRNGVRFVPQKIAGLWQSTDATPRLIAVELANGAKVPCDALFIRTQAVQASPLAAQLGCRADKDGRFGLLDERERTSVPRVYVAGDAAMNGSSWISTAAAEGQQAGASAAWDLSAEDWK